MGSSCEPRDPRRRENKRELAELNAGIEGEEGERDLAFWETDLGERAREAEPVKETKKKRHHPRSFASD